MSFVPEMKQLRGLSYDVASLYGMPHINAVYRRADDIRLKTRWEGERICAVCGRTQAPSWSVHHEPPKSKGSGKNPYFHLMTKMGAFPLKPALIGLCGSGTEGCHGDRHNGLLRIRWVWESDEIAEKWWNGHWLSHDFAPHSHRLFELGHYEFERGGMVKRVRGLSDVKWREFE